MHDLPRWNWQVVWFRRQRSTIQVSATGSLASRVALGDPSATLVPLAGQRIR